ncbi:hypothetical protein GCM10020001_066900 [Nonomuraea salmonea]
MLGQRDLTLEDEVLADDERDLMSAEERDRARLAHGGDAGVHGVDVDQLRLFARQAQQDGLVTAVALAGQAERAVQDDLHAGHLVEHSVLVQAAGELVSGGHRAARVGARRADADLEEVEDADRH